MKLKLILPFVALVLVGTATGQQPAQPAAKPPLRATAPVSAQRQTREPIPGEAPPLPESPPREMHLMDFPGGGPRAYIAAVDKALGTHLSEIATISDEADHRVSVPRIRAKLAVPGDAISIYETLANANGQSRGRLGEWQMRIGNSPDDLAALIFLPPQSQMLEGGLDVRAVSLRDIPEGKWKAFADLLDETIKQQREKQSELAGMPALPFSLKIHPDTGMLVAMGGKEQMDQVEKLAATMRTSFVVRSGAGEEGVKARAFSVVGLSPETVTQIVREMMNRSDELRAWQAKMTEQAGTTMTAGVSIFGAPEVVESLHVLVVAGNSAGLEFAGSLIEEVKVALEAAGPGKFVIVDGAVGSRGSVPWTPKLTVLDAIAAAGGRSAVFGDNIRLTRDGTSRILNYKELKFDPAKNERVRPGDHIEMGYLPKPDAPQDKP